ncbi:hypothetical protein ACQP3F_33495, partial [Escherichia coli]
ATPCLTASEQVPVGGDLQLCIKEQRMWKQKTEGPRVQSAEENKVRVLYSGTLPADIEAC